MASGWESMLRSGRRLARRASLLWRSVRPRSVTPRDPGERIALRHLEREGWTAIAANLRLSSGEADLVFRELWGRPVLVEVKSGAGGGDDPGLRAGPAKIRRLAAIAEELGRDLGEVPRIDLVVVRLGPGAEVIRHERGLGLPDRVGPPRRRLGGAV